MGCRRGNAYEQHAHLHRVIDEATKAGIDLIGIGIKSTAVKNYYPRHVVLSDITTIPGTVMGELKRILTA